MKKSVWNVGLAIAVATGMFASYYYLERAFQRGDVRRSIEAVQKARTNPESPTILELLTKEYGKNAQIIWTGWMKDTVKGIVIVAAQLPDKTVRRWQVSVLNGTVKPIENSD
jgi:hypothetical protein